MGPCLKQQRTQSNCFVSFVLFMFFVVKGGLESPPSHSSYPTETSLQY
jgi:hypothetical protein